MVVGKMHHSRLPLSRLSLAAGSLLVFGCTPPDNEQARERSPVVNNQASRPVPVPAPEVALDREGVLLAALRAATAAALGTDDTAAQAALKGRRFEVRIRFGCPNSIDIAGSGWTHDAAKGVLRARVRADFGADALEASGLAESGYEGAVGFTLRRAWMVADGCPDPRFAAVSGGPAVAITQLFTDSDSRVQRPKDAYDAVAPVTPEEIPGSGLNLILSGRFEPLPDGRSIRCAAEQGPPACIISSMIDRIAIEDPAREVVIAEFGTR